MGARHVPSSRPSCPMTSTAMELSCFSLQGLCLETHSARRRGQPEAACVHTHRYAGVYVELFFMYLQTCGQV